jgi:uncharacterized short protein YbdD (DUF466 family)
MTKEQRRAKTSGLRLLARAMKQDGVVTEHQLKHHPDCQPIMAEEEVFATEIDRQCRKKSEKEILHRTASTTRYSCES